MRIAALLALGAAIIATPALADTTVIHAGAVVVDAASQPRGQSTVTVTDGRIVPLRAMRIHELLDEHSATQVQSAPPAAAREDR